MSDSTFRQDDDDDDYDNDNTPSASHNTSDRPEIMVIAGALPETVDRVEQILHDTGGVYQRGGVLVRIGKVILPPVAGVARQPFLGAVPFNVGAMVDILTRRIYWSRFDSKQKKDVMVNCPRDAAATLLDRVGQWSLPALHAITTAPTLRYDGSILDRPGFDAATGIYYDPQNVVFPEISEHPTFDEARRSLDILIDLVREVPFVAHEERGQINRSVFLSAFLTSVIRSALPFAPMHAWDAPVRGSGKTMLTDTIAIAQTGNNACHITQGEDDTEMEKRISAVLLSGDPVVSVDNCSRPLQGDLLCQAVTSPIISIRPLGRSEAPKIQNAATFLADGNNLLVSEDMSRRVLRCTIDPQREDPESRPFTTVKPDILVARERGKYVVAALTILRAFHVAGRPPQAATTEGFEDWTRWVRDALIWLGEPDPWFVTEGTKRDDPERQKTVAVLREWHKVFGNEALKVQEVLDKVLGEREPAVNTHEEGKLLHHELKEALVAVAPDSNYIDKQKLGNWLSKHKQGIVGGYQLTGKPVMGYVRWTVTQLFEVQE